MSDSDKDFEAPIHPMGWVTVPGGEPRQPEPPPVDAPAEQHRPRRRGRPLAAAAVAVGLLATAAAGAGIGHELWTPSGGSSSFDALPVANNGGASLGNGSAFANNGSFGNSGGGSFGQNPFTGSNGSSGTTASGSPSDVSAIASKVDPALVDINSTFTYQSAQGAGTGIVVSSNGEVITNNHVIDGATKITATDVGNGKTYTATVIGYDASHDIAVLQLQNASGLDAAQFGDSSKAASGEAIVAIGNAGGSGGQPSTAAGSITATGTTVTAGDELDGLAEHLSGMIEVNADVQEGDSGGPLVNSQGQVIGMDTAGSLSYGFNGSGSQAYAIPINSVLAAASAVEASHGSSTLHVGATAFLGVSVSSGSSLGVEPGSGLPGGGFGFGVGNVGGSGFGFGGSGSGSFGSGSGSSTSSSSGLTVEGVLSGDPAAKAGIAQGDVITALDGHAISSETDLSSLLVPHHPGDSVSVTWKDAQGTSHSATLTLASGPPA